MILSGNITKTRQQKLRLTALYVRSHGLATFLVGCPVFYFPVMEGGFAAGLIWYKVLTSIGYIYWLSVYYKHEMVLYQNFGLSVRFLSITLLIMDLSSWLLIAYGIHLGSR